MVDEGIIADVRLTEIALDMVVERPLQQVIGTLARPTCNAINIYGFNLPLLDTNSQPTRLKCQLSPTHTGQGRFSFFLYAIFSYREITQQAPTYTYVLSKSLLSCLWALL